MIYLLQVKADRLILNIFNKIIKRKDGVEVLFAHDVRIFTMGTWFTVIIFCRI